MTTAGLHWVLEERLPMGLSAQAGRLDAYLVWDLFTDFQRHADLAALPGATGQAGGGRWLPLVAELADPPAQSLATMAAARPPSALPDLARRLGRWSGVAGLSAIQTAIVPESLIPALASAVAAGLLQRFQLGAPCAPPRPAELAPPPGWPAWLPPGPLHTLGVIDDGCCLAHQDFRSAAGDSRLLWLWDQTPDAAAGAHWRRHAGAPGLGPAYGMELSNPAIGGLLRDPVCGQLGEPGERALYAAINRPGWGPPDHSHGARVMHLLAGPGADAAGPGPGADAATGAVATAAGQGGRSAAELPLVFVQLPAQTIADTSGDSLALHVIDGARYIVGRTQAMADGAETGWSTTVNISLGGIAGPHDGSSLAELALDELAADARIAVVVSAGNAADRQHVHAQRSVADGMPGDFFIDLPAGQRQDSFIEFWLPDDGRDGGSWQLQLTPPGAVAPAQAVVAGQVASLREAGGAPVACLVFARQVAQGLYGTMALLALAPTAAPPAPSGSADRALAPPGLWQVQLRSAAETPMEVHAWVERDDVLIGERQPQLTRFELDARQPRHAQYVNDRFTLSTLAHGRHVIAAGAMVVSSHAVAPYSSQGPCRGPVPRDVALCYAPGDRSPSQPGVRVAGFYSGQSAAMGGTSAAAPQVARRLVETGSAIAPDAATLTDPDGGPLPQPAAAGRAAA